MWDSFNEVDELEEGKDYICVIDTEAHCFETIEDANNYIAYQAENFNPEGFIGISYSYQIHNIKCTGIVKAN